MSCLNVKHNNLVHAVFFKRTTWIFWALMVQNFEWFLYPRGPLVDHCILKSYPHFKDLTFSLYLCFEGRKLHVWSWFCSHQAGPIIVEIEPWWSKNFWKIRGLGLSGPLRGVRLKETACKKTKITPRINSN